MIVTVLFPKAQAYNNKSLEEKRFIDSVFQKYMNRLTEANCFIEYLLEDELAVNYFKKVSYPNSRVITCVSPSDILYFKEYQNQLDLTPDVYENFGGTPNFSFNIQQSYDVPFEMLTKGKDVYMKEKISCYYKRVRKSVELLLNNRRAILMFDAGAINNRCPLLSTMAQTGDGKLLMQIELSTGIERTYYGGVYIEPDMVPAILSFGD